MGSPIGNPHLSLVTTGGVTAVLRGPTRPPALATPSTCKERLGGGYGEKKVVWAGKAEITKEENLAVGEECIHGNSDDDELMLNVLRCHLTY